MTNKHVSILLAAFLMSTIGVAKEAQTKSKVPRISTAELNQAIIGLFQSGVISASEAKALVGRTSVLEELNKQGRVVMASASPSSICFKPN